MRRPEFIARQAGCPSGVLGHFLARVMALETARDNERAVELLAPRPADHVLEIGFGHGRTIGRMAGLVRDGAIAGVEVSERMLGMAARFNRRLIEQGRLELKLAHRTAAIPYGAGRFDRVLSVHTLYFWPEPGNTFREVRRVTKRGGRLVIGFRRGERDSIVRDFPASVYRFYKCDEVERLLEEAGFREIRLATLGGDARGMVFAIAE